MLHFKTDQKNLGVMIPGQYEFNTQLKELMEINSGELDIKLFDKPEWRTIKGGMNFEVPKNSSFKVKFKKLVNYTCAYFE